MCSSSSAPVIAQRAAGMPQRATAARRADGSDEPSGGAQPVRPRSAKPPRRARSEAEASMELGAAMLATEADHVHHVLAGPSGLKVVPLLQAFLFDDEFCAAAAG